MSRAAISSWYGRAPARRLGRWRVRQAVRPYRAASGTRVQGQCPCGGDQDSAGPALDGAGSIVVAWQSEQDGGFRGVFGRRFTGVAGAADDTDGDGVADAFDNCPTVVERRSARHRRDGYGDACVSPDVALPATASLGRNPSSVAARQSARECRWVTTQRRRVRPALSAGLRWKRLRRRRLRFHRAALEDRQ